MKEARQKLEEVLDVGLDRSFGLRCDRHSSNNASSDVVHSSPKLFGWSLSTIHKMSWRVSFRRTEDVKQTNQ